jgi:hypothetical protein
MRENARDGRWHGPIAKLVKGLLELIAGTTSTGVRLFPVALLMIAMPAPVRAEVVTPAQAQSGLYKAYQVWRNRIISLDSVTGQSDTLAQYAAKCDAATGIQVPRFSCGDGIEVPGQGSLPAGSAPNITCDRPNVLNSQCDPGSRFQVLPGRSADAAAVAHCRKVGLPIEGSEYNDIAVIQYNKNNGAICFYQALTNLPGQNIPPPRDGESAPWSDGQAHWLSPPATQAIGCTGCHDNGGFIRSEYLAQLKTPPNALPSVADGFNNLHTPARYVGLDYKSNRSWSIATALAPNDHGLSCTTCHRLAVPNRMAFARINGTAAHFATEATARSQPAKNPHGPNSPIWMRPGQVFYDPLAEASATKYQDCAIAFVNSGFTSALGCDIQPLGEPWSEPSRSIASGPNLLQSDWGNQGNFELLVPHGNTIKHYFRNNDDPTLQWHFLREFGYPSQPNQSDRTPRSVAFIQSNFKGDSVHGNFEGVVRVHPAPIVGSDFLDFWFLDSRQGKWNGPFGLIADGQPVTGATGDPVLIQSTWGNQGNFELLVPHGNTIKHYFRNNDDPTLQWHFLREFGYPSQPNQSDRTPRSVAFIQSNLKGDGVHGNFEAVVRVHPVPIVGSDFLDFWFLDSRQGKWNGPFGLIADGQPVTGVTGDPVLIQSTWGNQGNFELLVPHGNTIKHYFRNNDDPTLQWHFLREFGYSDGRTPRSVTFIQSNFKGDGSHGNFEAIVRVASPTQPDVLDFWVLDSGQGKWNGPFGLVADGQPVAGVTGN